MKKYYFRKEERLCSVKQIEQLYSQGSSFSFYPFRLIYSIVPEQDSPATIVISIPKRKFKKAVDRNTIKRRVKEVYRHSKADFLYPQLLEKNIKIQLLLIYIGNEINTSINIRKKLNLALERLVNKL